MSQKQSQTRGPKPPKTQKHPELWWNNLASRPVIEYPDGGFDFFELEENVWISEPHFKGSSLRNKAYKGFFTFIMELK